MFSIGDRIAELRKAKGMTQEELSATIGVSAQTVSKWENGVNMPDIMLLPVLADIFGVTTDELLGRSMGGEAGPDGIYTCVVDRMLEKIAAYMGNGGPEAYKKYRDALAGDRLLQTGVMNGRDGAVYYSGKTGAVLLERHGEELFSNEKAAAVLDRLGDALFRKTAGYICGYKMTSGRGSVTAAALSKKLGAPENAVQGCLDYFEELGVCTASECDTGDGKLKVYFLDDFSRGKLFALEVVFTYAAMFAESKNSYYSWCG